MPFVLDLTLKASALLLLAAAAALPARRSAAAQRHFVWTLTLTGLLVLPLLAALVPWRLRVVPVLAAVPAVERQDGSGYGSRLVREAAPMAAAPAGGAAAVKVRGGPASVPAPATTDATPVVTMEGVLALLWLAGLAVLGARLVADLVAMRRILRVSRPLDGPAWRRAVSSAAERLGIPGTADVFECDLVAMPMAFGLRWPAIVVPRGADDWSLEQRDIVLLHELAHVRRGDVIGNLVSQLACALYWFHPLVWGAARRLRVEAERACDDLVLGAGAPPSTYAAHLLAMVRGGPMLRAPFFAVPMAQRSDFEGRVLAILEPGLARHGVSRGAAMAGAVALAVIALPLAALGPRPSAPSAPNPRIQQVPDLAPPARPEVFLAADDGGAPAVVEAVAGAEYGAEAKVAEERSDEQEEAPSPAAAAALVVALSDADEGVRLAAAQALGARGDTAAINALLLALRRDASREVRRVAAWALGEIEDGRAVGGLLAALREERDAEVRRAIVHALGEIEDAEAVDGLGAALRGENDPETRRGIVWALGEIESAEAVRHLVPVLRDQDVETRRMAVWALGEIESGSAVEPIAALLAQERNPETREMAVWALGEIEDRRAVPALEAALRDSSAAIRGKAAWALGEIDDVEVAPAGLVAALQDNDAEVRRQAAHALAEIADPASVPALAAALRDPDIEVRRSAINALGEIRGPAAVEALVAAMRDEDPEIRRLAAQALGNR